MDWRKTCPTCGAANDPAEMMCGRCLGDISGIAPVAAAPTAAPAVAERPESPAPPVALEMTAAEVAPRLALVDPDGRRIAIAPGATVGRGFAGKEWLESIPTVSRGHARFHFIDGRWFVEDLGAMNGTFLAGRRLEAGRREPVTDGQALGLSSRAQFRIAIEG